ncbi:Sec20-domain-containing protein [Multifurca ochricompacta]|uniref:Sec20-domain-containing protein n=1 Tax=Multifurca ochricompacta TaxID=376703 RepID=A0AAD4M1W9_9AGAM|nr:Sec20-domain-containing protein [Multifurca ochricompacta]
MPPLPLTFDDDTNVSIASIQRRQNDLRDFQIPRLRGCSESLAIQQQCAAELREDLETITRLVDALDETVDLQRSEGSRKGLRGIIQGLRADLLQLRKDMRAALLASKRAIDSKASSNREELLRSSVMNQTKTSEGKTTEDAVMQAQGDVTDALRRTMALMQSELERSVLSTQMLEASTASLKATSSTQDVLTGLLGTSKQLVTALEKADWLDRMLIFAALTFFALVILFILKQRIVDRGLRIAFWWTRFLPSWDWSEPQLGVKESALKGTTSTQSVVATASSIIASTATALVSQVAHAAGSEWNEPGEHASDTSDTLSHVSSRLDTADSGSFPVISTTTATTSTPPSKSVHDEL